MVRIPCCRFPSPPTYFVDRFLFSIANTRNFFTPFQLGKQVGSLEYCKGSLGEVAAVGELEQRERSRMGQGG